MIETLTKLFTLMVKGAEKGTVVWTKPGSDGHTVWYDVGGHLTEVVYDEDREPMSCQLVGREEVFYPLSH